MPKRKVSAKEARVRQKVVKRSPKRKAVNDEDDLEAMLDYLDSLGAEEVTSGED